MQEWFLTILGGVDLRLAVVISILLEILVAVLGLFPSIFITAANVAIFGVINGFIVSTIGEVLGAQVAFYLYRYGFRKPIQKRMKNRWVERIFNHRKEIGFSIIVQGRLIPFIPAGLVTLYAAVSSISGFFFILASTLGKLPAMIIEVLVAYGIMQLSTMYILIGLVVVVGFVITRWIYKRSTVQN